MKLIIEVIENVKEEDKKEMKRRLENIFHDYIDGGEMDETDYSFNMEVQD